MNLSSDLSNISSNPFKLADIAQLKKFGKKIIVKGILCKEDALAALENGADAIWISNESNMKS